MEKRLRMLSALLRTTSLDPDMIGGPKWRGSSTSPLGISGFALNALNYLGKLSTISTKLLQAECHARLQRKRSRSFNNTAITNTTFSRFTKHAKDYQGSFEHVAYLNNNSLN